MIITDKRAVKGSTFKEIPIGGTFNLLFGDGDAIMMKTFVNFKEVAVSLSTGACIELPGNASVMPCSCELLVTK